MTPEEIKNAVEIAFRPLRCVAEIWDYQRNLKFLVCAPNGDAICEVRSCPLPLFASKDELRRFLTDMRNSVKEKGFTLDSWELN